MRLSAVRARSAAGGVAAATLLASLALACVPARASAALPRSRIVTVSTEGLVTIDHAGGDRKVVLRQDWALTGGIQFPKWSPDGSWIAYINNSTLFVIRPDGSDKRQLPAGGGEPSWSADGRTIYVAMGTGVGAVRLDGGEGPPFTNTTGGVERDVRWSPDGTRAAFASDAGGGQYRTYIRNADGTGLRGITTGGMDEFPVDWSPDGRSLLVMANDHTTALWTVVVDADGGNRRQVRMGSVPQAWSPDGRRILAYDGHDGRLHTMNADGTGVTFLADVGGAGDWGPGSVDRDPTPAPTSAPTTTIRPAPPPPLPVNPTVPTTRTTVAARAPGTTTPTNRAPAPSDAASLAAFGTAGGQLDAGHTALEPESLRAAAAGSTDRAPFIGASFLLLAAVSFASCRLALRGRALAS
jgi:hypothetical protein